MPRDFLEPYVRERLERQEMLLFEQESRLLCVGELRRDQQIQPAIDSADVTGAALDLGANIGWFTVYMARRFAKVLAWERKLGIPILPLSAGEETLPQIRRLLGLAASRR